MKIYYTQTWYYDNCDVWNEYDSFWFTEDQSILRQIEIEEQYKREGLPTEHYGVDVGYIEVQGEMDID
jgi:hypothetical protein